MPEVHASALALSGRPAYACQHRGKFVFRCARKREAAESGVDSDDGHCVFRCGRSGRSEHPWRQGGPDHCGGEPHRCRPHGDTLGDLARSHLDPLPRHAQITDPPSINTSTVCSCPGATFRPDTRALTQYWRRAISTYYAIDAAGLWLGDQGSGQLAGLSTRRSVRLSHGRNLCGDHRFVTTLSASDVSGDGRARRFRRPESDRWSASYRQFGVDRRNHQLDVFTRQIRASPGRMPERRTVAPGTADRAMACGRQPCVRRETALSRARVFQPFWKGDERTPAPRGRNQTLKAPSPTSVTIPVPGTPARSVARRRDAAPAARSGPGCGDATSDLKDTLST